MTQVKRFLMSAALVLGLVGAPVLAAGVASAAPVTPQQQVCEGSGGTWTAGSGDKKGSCTNANAGKAGNLTSVLKTIVNMLLFLIGVISVIMIVVGGIRYTVSGGDSTQTSNAKNTILYAVVGIVVAILAYAIVNFVVGAFS